MVYFIYIGDKIKKNCLKSFFLSGSVLTSLVVAGPLKKELPKGRHTNTWKVYNIAQEHYLNTKIKGH